MIHIVVGGQTSQDLQIKSVHGVIKNFFYPIRILVEDVKYEKVIMPCYSISS